MKKEKDLVEEIEEKKPTTKKRAKKEEAAVEEVEVKKVDKLVYDENKFESNRILIENNYKCYIFSPAK